MKPRILATTFTLLLLFLGACDNGPRKRPDPTIPQPRFPLGRVMETVEFEGVLRERLPSPKIWCGGLMTFQGIRYEVIRVLRGELAESRPVVFYALIEPPLTEEREPVLNRALFREGERLRLRARRYASGALVTWQDPLDAIKLQ